MQLLVPKAAALHREQGGEAHFKHLSISEIFDFFCKIDALAERHLVAKEHTFRFGEERVLVEPRAFRIPSSMHCISPKPLQLQLN